MLSAFPKMNWGASGQIIYPFDVFFQNYPDVSITDPFTCSKAAQVIYADRDRLRGKNHFFRD
jgi:hypothetical protein